MTGAPATRHEARRYRDSGGRLALVVQDDAYLDISTVLLVLISSDARFADMVASVPVAPSAANGLRVRSYVTVHDLATVRRDKVDKYVGRLEDDLMQRVESALIFFLGLDR